MIVKTGDCLIKSHAKQVGEVGLMFPTMSTHVLIDVTRIKSRVLVSLPRVDGEALRTQVICLHNLTHHKEGVAKVRPKLDGNPRFERLNKVTHEGGVLNPRTRPKPLWLKERRLRQSAPERNSLAIRQGRDFWEGHFKS